MTKNFIRNGVVVIAVIVTVATVAHVRQAKFAESRESTSDRVNVTAQAAAMPRGLPRMIDLGADKCIPCKKMAPILTELKTEYIGRASIEFVDVWKNPEAGKPYEFRVIPTQVFFDREGKEVWRHEGFLAKDEIKSRLKELGAG
jgi:thiol-disulfide isomerase/thioredoxin